MKNCAWAAILMAAASCPAGAQSLYKCVKDKAVTYSSTPCEQLGLRPGGEIQDRVTTMPLGQPGQKTVPVTRPRSGTASGQENEIELPRTSTLRPVSPLIEKLVK